MGMADKANSGEHRLADEKRGAISTALCNFARVCEGPVLT